MKDLILSIINIFRWTGKIFTIIRNTILNIGLLIVLVIFLFAFISSSAPKTPLVKRDSGLVLTIAGDIVEEKKLSDPINDLLNEAMGFDNPYQEVLLQDILDGINSAAKDQNISYMVLDLSRMGGAGLPQLEVIGKAITKFKKTGKKVLAAEDYFTQSQYYLATFSDEIIINPMGGVELHGFGVYRLYFKKALDKLKVNYNIFRVGTHKSALEPVMRNSMSQEDRSQNRAWLGSLWGDFTTHITKNRKLPENRLQSYTNESPANLKKVSGDTAKLALEMGLVDKIMTRNELHKYLASLSTKVLTTKPRTIKLNDYLKSINPSYEGFGDNDKKVGLIIAEGTIFPGIQPIGSIGGDSLSATIRRAREDKDIKCVVLRIDSGGGSAFASEIIRQELLELQKSGKPLVVSMGNVAASGGYWIAANADEIWASPTTITGSIGIFGAIPTFENSLASIGVYGDGVGTTDIASGINITLPLAKDIKKTVQLSVEHGYATFLSIVSKGRDLSIEDVHSLANGKVYAGTKAVELGLVDNLGSLQDAIASAAAFAGLDDYDTVYVRKPQTFKEKFFSQLQSASLGKLFLKNNLPQSLQKTVVRLEEIISLDDPNDIYAHSLLSSDYIQ